MWLSEFTCSCSLFLVLYEMPFKILIEYKQLTVYFKLEKLINMSTFFNF